MQDKEKNTKAKGSQYEDDAAKYLIDAGWKIEARNYSFHKGEIDIIARERDTLVFVEVRMKETDEYGLPEESFTPHKIKTVRKTAEGYLFENKIDDVACRFDVIAIVPAEGGKLHINHIRDAF